MLSHNISPYIEFALSRNCSSYAFSPFRTPEMERKIVTGIRRCGKSYLLRTIFKKHLIESGVDEAHIVEMAFDLYDNIEYRDPKVFYPWAKGQIKDDGTYYFQFV